MAARRGRGRIAGDDYDADPDALRNLIDAPELADIARQMRAEVLDWMRRKQDPLLEKYEPLASGAPAN